MLHEKSSHPFRDGHEHNLGVQNNGVDNTMQNPSGHSDLKLSVSIIAQHEQTRRTKFEHISSSHPNTEHFRAISEGYVAP